LVQISGIFVLGQKYEINSAAAALVLEATAETLYQITINRYNRKKPT